MTIHQSANVQLVCSVQVNPRLSEKFFDPAGNLLQRLSPFRLVEDVKSKIVECIGIFAIQHCTGFVIGQKPITESPHPVNRLICATSDDASWGEIGEQPGRIDFQRGW